MNRNTLQTLAEELSVQHRQVRKKYIGKSLGKFAISRSARSRFEKNCSVLEREYFADKISDSASEWLVENYNLITLRLDEIAKQIRHIPSGIPVLKEGLMSGFPRIYAIAVEFIDFTAGIVTQDALVQFLQDYQKQTPLTVDELWSVSCAFSLALARNILALAGRRCAALYAENTASQAAKELCTGNTARFELSQHININDATELAALIRYVQSDAENTKALRLLDAELASRGITASNVLDFARHIETNCSVTVQNSITSLMKLQSFDWEDIMEKSSPVDRIFSMEESGIYPAMDAQTKNCYRRRVRKLALLKGVDETYIAAQISMQASEEKCHVGKLLFQEKRRDKTIQNIYIALNCVITAALLLSVFFVVYQYQKHWLAGLLAVFFGVIPCAAIGEKLVNILFGRLLKPRYIPKMDFTSGIPESCKTVIVVPTLLTDEKNAVKAAEKLELHGIAANSDNVYCVLLGDWSDSHEERDGREASIVELVEERVQQLNQKYGAKRFFYFQRDRMFNEKQGMYMGWERKRGAVVQFNHSLQSGDFSDFSHVSEDAQILVGSRFIMTLDADTRLPFGSLAKIVGAAAHPLNEPEVDREQGRVVNGYGMFQPKMGVSLPSSLKSPFAWLISGDVGSEPYSGTVFEVQQDVFGEGSFAGKGLFDSKLFDELVGSVLPENTILSHDMLEGSILRTAFVSDAELTDDVPSGYIAWKKRAHRWLRGDWQLAAFLKRNFRDKDGNIRKNHLSSVTKYKIRSNMARGLVLFEICMLLLLGSFYRPVFWVGISLLLLNSFLPPVISTLFAIFRAKERQGLGKFYCSSGFEVVTAVDMALTNIDAVVRTLYRMKKQKRLLEWQTAFQAESLNKNSLKYFWANMWRSALCGAVIAVIGCIFGVYGAVLVLLITLGAPFLAFAMSRPHNQMSYIPEGEEKEIIEECAKGAWKYFDELCNEEHHYLPPDNFQEEPFLGSAERTSPTNIAMFLAGAVAACLLGYIDEKSCIARIQKTLETLDSLEKHNGQPFNWYQTTTCQPMHPRFVSSADNGNLACALLVVKTWCSKFEEGAYCAELCGKLLNEMNFAVFFDRAKGLLSIGIDAENGELSTFAYDLVASEARQASFYGIISGALPAWHWQKLSRTVTELNGRRILKSWSGSMFEYFMPQLFIRTYRHTLWSEAFSEAITQQIHFGLANEIPWGVSESGYCAFDDMGAYQYKAFGIPSLAVRNVRENEKIIAPYATALVLPFVPEKAARNLMQLKKLGMLGSYGFYEAADFNGENRRFIKSYMAHHQGMSLIAAANCLKNNVIVDLFHSAPEVQAGEDLLWEKPPVEGSSQQNVRSFHKNRGASLHHSEKAIEVYSPAIQQKHCAMLSNGNFTTVFCNTGEEISFCGGVYVNARNFTGEYGNFFFIKDIRAKRFFSLTAAPVFGRSERCTAVFEPDSIIYSKKEAGLETCMKIAVSPVINAQVRKITIRNTQNKNSEFELVNYLEPVLEGEEQNLAHPVYSAMFVNVHFSKSHRAVILKRTPRHEGDKAAYACVCVCCDRQCDVTATTSKKEFIGRNPSIAEAQYLKSGKNKGKKGTTPLASLSVTLSIPQGKTVQAAYVTAVAESMNELYEITRGFETFDGVDRVFALAYEHSLTSVQHEEVNATIFRLFNALLTRIYFPQPSSSASGKRSDLWRLGISGDLPIICYNCSQNCERTVRLLLQLHLMLMKCGITADLVFITNDDGYRKDCFDLVEKLASTSRQRHMIGKKGGIFMVRGEKDSAAVKLIKSYASVVLHGDEAVVSAILERGRKALYKSARRDRKRLPCKPYDIPKLSFYNGYGGYDDEKREYVICLNDGLHTPAPWSNILANRQFGTIVTESGGGFTWLENARENKLTRWSNDPEKDTPSEMIYIRDENSGQSFALSGLTPEGGSLRVRHGLGYSIFERNALDVFTTQTVFVPWSDTVKLTMLKINNNSDSVKKLSVYYFADFCLSPAVKFTQEKLSVALEKTDNLLLITNKSSDENYAAYMAANRPIEFVYNEKNMFFGLENDRQSPAALRTRLDEVEYTSKNGDCGVIKVTLELKPHCTDYVILQLGAGRDAGTIRHMKNKYCGLRQTIRALDEVKQKFEQLCTGISIQSADRAFNSFFNTFLQYQVLVCRYFARTSFYQCSGAYGFRDQLQDSLGFMYADKSMARAHILKAAAQQFEEGDVRHWWHESNGCGVRTKISDDMLFLPYVACEYADFSGDYSIFDEQVPFICGQEIEPGKTSHFGTAITTDTKATLYEHCIRAIKRALRFGKHGLPLIGTGDWNDGFDRIGEKGQGESVWLAFFLWVVIDKFKKISQRRDDSEIIDLLEANQKLILQGIEQNGWDGRWFRRAYYDDGLPIGSAESDECKIDVIAQAWAAISGAVSKEKIEMALQSAWEMLVDEEVGIVKLFTPPFKNTDHDPGYIKAYNAGLRENGGQYTHGAIWLLMAYAMRGDRQKCGKLLKLLNPVHHARDMKGAEKYCVEPYVIAADVYSAEGFEGMGGWSWYTGSASWFYRVSLELIFGIKIRGEKLILSPCIPDKMMPCRITFVYEQNGQKSHYTVDIAAQDDAEYLLDDAVQESAEFPLIADGNDHKIIMRKKSDDV